MTTICFCHGLFFAAETYGTIGHRQSTVENAMIRPCTAADFDTMSAIINDAAQAYCGVIPADRWHEPYMSKDELRHEITSGVRFWGWEEGGKLVGVMGIQDVQDVTLIRHAYVRTANRGQGIGGKLLTELRKLTARPVLIGTWAAATWAICFYEKHGFQMVTPEEKDRLLKKYWSISKRQIETSVVMAEENWFSYCKANASCNAKAS
jgi:N-acetylglutamate synthase-like GNAT family acetyltransferase